MIIHALWEAKHCVEAKTVCGRTIKNRCFVVVRNAWKHVSCRACLRSATEEQREERRDYIREVETEFAAIVRENLEATK